MVKILGGDVLIEFLCEIEEKLIINFRHNFYNF
jgi:hypothetical protein